MSVKPTKVQFNGGELSPWLEGRTDIAKYDKTAKLCRNFIPLAEGSLKRRGGTRFVAVTPAGEEIMLKVIAYPEDAQIFLNGEQTDILFVARGDKVNFEVKSKGFASQYGEVRVTEDMTLTVKLISYTQRCKLEIIPVPDDATVKIGGVERRSYDVYKNSDIPYEVCKDGYETESGTIFMDRDKTLTVELEHDAGAGGSYGDWGVPSYFVACSAVGWVEQQKKCFVFRFTNGYLAIVFDANKQVPDDAAEWVFLKTALDGYNTVCRKNGAYQFAYLKSTSSSYNFVGLDGKVLVSYSFMEMMVMGWQLDEDGNYATVYRRYDGTTSGAVAKVYYDGKMVWSMKERKNG